MQNPLFLQAEILKNSKAFYFSPHPSPLLLERELKHIIT